MLLQTESLPFYETGSALSQYLLFHYGEEADLMPYGFGPRDSLHFPVRCVDECLDKLSFPTRALDLGCAVGRTSFELSRHCKSVTGVDYSSAFISAAKTIQQRGPYEYTIKEEGVQTSQRQALLPQGTNPERISFICADAMEFATRGERFDVVLAANLICRLSDPSAFLSLLKNLVVKGGQLIITAPYSWLEEYTAMSCWLGVKGTQTALDVIRDILEPDFKMQRCFDMPFLIREHARKFQWIVAQATTWKRKSSL